MCVLVYTSVLSVHMCVPVTLHDEGQRNTWGTWGFLLYHSSPLLLHETRSHTEPGASSPRNLPVFTLYSGGVAGIHAVTLVCCCCCSVCLFAFTWMLGIYKQALLLMQCMFLPAVAEAKAISPLPAEEN